MWQKSGVFHRLPSKDTLGFVITGIVPILVVVLIFLALYFVLRFEKDTLYLLIFCSVFGSLAFFGIPFIMFAFPTPYAEHLAILVASSISIVSVIIALTVLELYGLRSSSIREGLGNIVRCLPRNPLILSIAAGTALSFLGISIPVPLSTVLHMLGRTTGAVALFMLGTFLFGRRYGNLFRAFALSLLRIAFLPLIAFLVARAFRLPPPGNFHSGPYA